MNIMFHHHDLLLFWSKAEFSLVPKLKENLNKNNITFNVKETEKLLL